MGQEEVDCKAPQKLNMEEDRMLPLYKYVL